MTQQMTHSVLQPRRAFIMTGAIALVVTPELATAHVVATTSMLAGALQPWVNVEASLLMIAVTIWLAQSARGDTRPYGVTSVALVAGMIIGLHSGAPSSLWMSGLTLCMGLTIAAALTIHARWRSYVPVLPAFSAGWWAGSDAAAQVTAAISFVFGAWVGGLVIPLLLGLPMGDQPSRALHISMRVIGSWIAAVGLIMLALRLAQPA